MLTQLRRRRGVSEEDFRDDETRSPLALGCQVCLDLPLCGGLHSQSGAFDCTAYCCGAPESCDVVCPAKPGEFVRRQREVGSYELASAGSSPLPLPVPELPDSVPMLYHRGLRYEHLPVNAIALGLYDLVDTTHGRLRFASRSMIGHRYGISPRTRIVVSGTHHDRPLERWWALGSVRRAALVGGLRDLGVVAATAPNYSLFNDVPRWDNLHAMKRIVLVWEEMIATGMPTALHVNARASADWRRWAQFVRHRADVTAVAYEFATGTGARMRWHAEGLRGLAKAVSRPLTLILRGGLPVYAELAEAFERVIVIDTSSAVRTAKRRLASLSSDARLRWVAAHTDAGEGLDDLLAHNVATMAAALRARRAAYRGQRVAMMRP